MDADGTIPVLLAADGPVARFLAVSPWTLLGRFDDRLRVSWANPGLSDRLGGSNELLTALLPPGSSRLEASLATLSEPEASRVVDLDFGPGSISAPATFRCLVYREGPGRLWILGERQADRLDPIAAELLAIHGDLARLHRRLHRRAETLAIEARTDPLTGLANRRQADAWLIEKVEAAAVSAEPLVLLLLDLDHFKRVNDTYGHPTGDSVLRVVGRVLAESTRASDLVARHGGEEFLVLCPGTVAEEGLAVAERLREAVRALVVPPVGEGLDLSAGLACLSAGESAESLLARADAALRIAKRAGRGRVILGD